MPKPHVNSAGIRRPPNTSSSVQPKPMSTEADWPPRKGSSSAQARRRDGDGGGGHTVLATAGDAARGDLVPYRDAGGVYGAEDGVCGGQQRVPVHHEELAAVRERPGVGHRQRAPRIADGLLQRRIARRVLIGRVFVGGLITWPTGSLTLRVTTPQHRQPRRRGQPVASGVVEKLLLRQADETAHRAR